MDVKEDLAQTPQGSGESRGIRDGDSIQASMIDEEKAGSKGSKRWRLLSSHGCPLSVLGLERESQRGGICPESRAGVRALVL